MDTVHIWINRYSESYRVTAKLNRHLGKNTTDGIFSITRNMDVALMRLKWIFNKPMSLYSKNTDLGIYEPYSLYSILVDDIGFHARPFVRQPLCRTNYLSVYNEVSALTPNGLMLSMPSQIIALTLYPAVLSDTLNGTGIIFDSPAAKTWEIYSISTNVPFES
mgnify:CR=1 FL=1